MLAAARSRDAAERGRALDTLISVYWKPVYKYIRLRWDKSAEDAEDLTQGFFTRLLEKDFLDGYDAGRARLRTFLRICVDRFIANQQKFAGSLKRGGATEILPLDFASAEDELRRIEPPAADVVEPFFQREFSRSLFTLAVEQLQAECDQKGKATHFRLFERYDLEDHLRQQSYEQLAREFQLTVSSVTNFLAYARREFRRIVLEKLREVSGSEEEFRREARDLLGLRNSEGDK